MIKTILDYGAKLYKHNDEALDGQVSSHQAIQDMLDDVGTATLPNYGSLFMGDSVFGWYERGVVNSLGYGNRSVSLVTDKPISMFVPIHNRNIISGFTAYYVGDKITEECAVVRLGGDERNIGGIHYKPNGKPYNRWENRTTAIGHNFDFDLLGDRKYYESATGSNSTVNPKFIENGNAHAVWVDYDNDTEDNTSNFHWIKIRGDWSYINTGIKITKRKGSKQAMNNLDMKVKIDGARMYADIHGTLNRSTIIINGQERSTLGFNENIPYINNQYIDPNKYDQEEWQVPMFYIEGSALNCGIYAYDRKNKSKMGRGRHKIKGQYHVRGLNLIFPLLVDENYIKVDADFNDSTFRQNSVIKSIAGVRINE